MGGFVFEWYHVKLYGVILLVQLLCIRYFYWSGRRGVIDDSINPDKVGIKTTNKMSFQDCLRACIYVPLMLYQFYLSWRFYNVMGLDWVTNLGWWVLTISAAFGWLPILEFKKRGGVPKDKSYIYTTELVTSGVYSVVRHPQFLAGILITMSMMLMSQHPHSVIAGTVAAIIYASEVPPADKRL